MFVFRVCVCVCGTPEAAIRTWSFEVHTQERGNRFGRLWFRFLPGLNPKPRSPQQKASQARIDRSLGSVLLDLRLHCTLCSVFGLTLRHSLMLGDIFTLVVTTLGLIAFEDPSYDPGALFLGSHKGQANNGTPMRITGVPST